ncbi:histidinol-phosphate transaminase [Vulcanisaeta souniana]|uniref:pyridoxal phosphate-dependent aminotransferase n=1 Tax=Vulcanisaeta souniana TaxID=164452 RepID=UPI0006D09B00|nr:histidinol-phosphate transaminase [Vulcanisaeta souniana]
MPWKSVLSLSFYEEPNVGYKVYRLHFNENLFLPPRQYYEKLLSAALDPELIRYYTEPPLNPTFNEALARYLNVDAGNVFTVAGGDEGLRLLIQFALHGLRKILIVEPTYSMPRILAESMGLTANQVLLRDGTYELNLEELIRLGGSHDIIYLCDPNNPTGNLFSREDIEYLVSHVDSLIVIDEAYAEFARFSVIDLTRDYENIAVIRTFSKAWGLAGLRVGYVVASDTVIDGLKRLSLPHNIPYTSMVLVLRALELRDYVERGIDNMVSVRDIMTKSLDDLGLNPIPSVTNFITFHVGSQEKANGVHEELLRRGGFVVRNLSGKVLCEDCLRVTVPPMNVAEMFISTLENIVKHRGL